MKVAVLAAIQLMTTDAVETHVRINGFDADALVSARANEAGDAPPGFETKMLEYSLLHPYFLKSANNTVELSAARKVNYDDDKAAKQCSARVVAIDHDLAADAWDTTWKTTELAKLAVPPLTDLKGGAAKASAKFAWSAPLPAWAWTTSKNKIANDAATKASLYAAHEAFWKTLAAQPSADAAARDAFAKSVTASTAEYEKASALAGRTDKFLEDFFVVTWKRDFRSVDAKAIKAAALKAAAKRASGPIDIAPPAHDWRPPPDPSMYDTPHLALTALPPAAELTLDVFADGALARLVKKGGGDGLISYRSNWSDGPWGAVGEEMVEVEVWFKKDASGAWVLDALVDRHMARLGVRGEVLNQVLETQYPQSPRF
jgi:hypothetical protein